MSQGVKSSGSAKERRKRWMDKAPKAYSAFKGMRARCNNPKNGRYGNYGGRGIVVCERWSKFSAFFADMGERPEGLTLERMDNNGNYEPGNCRWATRREQNGNQRKTIFVEYEGERIPLMRAAQRAGLVYSTVRYRIRKHGWPADQALTIPPLLKGIRRVNL